MKQRPTHGWLSRLLHRLFTAGCPCSCGQCPGSCGAGTTCSGHCRSPREGAEKCGQEITLADMRVGQRGRIIEVGEGNQDLINRFADHGLVRGIDVTVHERAPFGGPILAAVQGTMVALRVNEARLIRVCLRSSAP